MRRNNVDKPEKSRPLRLVCLFCLLSAVLATTAVRADDFPERRYTAAAHIAATITRVPVGKDYALGINRFDLDPHTELIGWRITDAWYFGRQDGLDSGLTLVWQQAGKQVSLSKDGVRLTRRF